MWLQSFFCLLWQRREKSHPDSLHWDLWNILSLLIRAWVCFHFANEFPKVLVNLSFTLYWGKKPTAPWFSCFNLCSMTDSPLQQDVGTSTIPVFRKSKTLIISWKWSDAQEFCDPHSLAPGVPSITPYLMSYRKHCSRCWGKANEPPTESWQVQQVNSPSCQLIPVGIYRTAGFPGTAHQCGKLKFSCSFLIHYYLHSILSKSHTAVTCPYYFIIYIIFSRWGPYWFYFGMHLQQEGQSMPKQ